MLEEYNRKRRFDQTPEPRGVAGESRGQTFVIQKHRASRLHYDLRLEMDGVLRSWAVPKGPSLDPGVKRLAVRTEDHPLDYGSFEGVIPEGNYGAGRVVIWDRGTYEMVDPATPGEAWKQQKFHVVLRGEKLGGEWVLVRTGRSDGTEWLFFKVRDAFASSADITRTRPESVVSGLDVDTIDEARGSPARRWHAAAERELERLGVKSSDRVAMPREISPMLATATDQVPVGDDWWYEIKLDGVRAVAFKQGAKVEILSRNQQPLGSRFPILVDAVRQLPADTAVLDGEIVAFDESGRSRFSLLQPRPGLRGAVRGEDGAADPPVCLSAFDLLYLNGFDLTGQPLRVRKSLLRTLIADGGWIRYTDHVEGDGAAFYAAAEAHQLEGIVAKGRDSAYHQGRSRLWLKVKTSRTEEFVVIAYTRPSGARRHLGALVLGQYDASGRLVYVGRAGSGFDDRGLEEAHAMLEAERVGSPILDPVPKELTGVRWVRPARVAEVRFSEWTREGKLRAPVFLRFRDDIEPRDCRLGAGSDESDRRLPDGPPHPASQLPPSPQDSRPGPFPTTNAGKVFWPEAGFTKGDLVRYYANIEETLAPYLEDRPLVLKRYPDGIGGDHFYQKDAPDHRPDWIRTEAIWSEDTQRRMHYFVGGTPGLLPYLANLGGITQNPWSSRVGRLDHPDYIVFDLDPSEGVPWRSVRKVALEINAALGELDLRAYPKTSGASGIHIFLPLLEDRFSYAQVRTFALAIASIVVGRVPDLATIERPVRRRPKAVYIDCLQNAKGQTVASVYSPRARPGAPVSTPLRWRDLERPLDPGRYTMRSIFRRLGQVGDLFRPVLEDRQDIGLFLETLERQGGLG